MTSIGGDLPPGWDREFEGRYGAEYYFEQRDLSVGVVPSYDDPALRASQSDIVGYVVRLQRLFNDQFGTPVEIAERETFEEAIETAKRYMSRISDRYERSGRSINEAVVGAIDDVATYSDATLVQVIRDRAGDSLGAVAHCGSSGSRVIYGDLAAADADRLSESLRERVTDGDRSALGSVTATAVMGDEATAVWISPDSAPDGEGTLLILDADASTDFSGVVQEATRLLSGRWD